LDEIIKTRSLKER